MSIKAQPPRERAAPTPQAAQVAKEAAEFSDDIPF
jgi:hypothetical protein